MGYVSGYAAEFNESLAGTKFQPIKFIDYFVEYNPDENEYYVCHYDFEGPVYRYYTNIGCRPIFKEV